MIYIALAWIFFFIGAISFGGGFAMLPLLERTLVDQWISHQQFLDILAISQATPGAFAINAATYVGALVAPLPILGSSIATIALSTPGFLLSYFVAYPMLKAKNHPFIFILIRYLSPTALGLISYAGLNLFSSELINNENQFNINIKSAIFILITFFILRYKLLSAVKLIIFMALLGIIASFL